MANKLFIMDFDGVLCDSVMECLLVTYNAYHTLHSASFRRAKSLDVIEPSKREQFRTLRAYLKGAEDFVPMFTAIEKNLPINNQSGFNRVREAYKDDLERFQEAFYGERDFLMQHEKELWLSLNPLFDGIRDALKHIQSFERMHILTTKRQEDVLAIFEYQGILFPADHITYMKAAGKTQKLLEILQENEAVLEDSGYIEDQVDFLIESQKQHIRSYLVEWGYVSGEQKALARKYDIPIINVEQFSEILGEFR